MFNIRRATAKSLLKAVGYEKADGYTDKLLAKKLGYLSDMTEEDAAEKIPGPLKRTFASLRRALANGDEPVLVDDALPAAPADEQPAPRGRPKSEDGISHTIIRLLQGASEDSPLSKADILAHLCTKYDDRDPQSMRTTLGKWVVSGLKHAGYDVRSNTHGYWIEPKAVSPSRADGN